MIKYSPRAGSMPARVIAHLLDFPPGTELTTAVLADALDPEAACVPSCLEYAVRNGLLMREKRDGRIYWRLGNGTPAQEPHDDDPPIQRVVSASALLPAAGQIVKPRRASVFSADFAGPPAPAAPSVQPRQLRIALWSDGQLVIERSTERIEFARGETLQILDYLRTHPEIAG